jgi:hypothetical protein
MKKPFANSFKFDVNINGEVGTHSVRCGIGVSALEGTVKNRTDELVAEMPACRDDIFLLAAQIEEKRAAADKAISDLAEELRDQVFEDIKQFHNRVSPRCIEMLEWLLCKERVQNVISRALHCFMSESEIADDECYIIDFINLMYLTDEAQQGVNAYLHNKLLAA